MKVAPKHQSVWRDLARLSAFAALVTLVIYVSQVDAVRQTLFDLHAIRNVLLGENLPGGALASSMLFFVCSGVLIGVGVPRLWVSAVAGAVYGSVLGAGLALLSSLLGASIVYCLGKFLLSTYILSRFTGKVATWARRFHENTFWWVLYIRLFPFANATASGMLCGGCKVPFRPFLAGSALGFIPLTIVFATFGSAGISGSFTQIALGFGLLVLTVSSRYFINRRGLPQDISSLGEE